MVRSLCVAAVSLVLIGALYFFCDGASRKTSERLLENCREIARMEQQGDSRQALERLRSMETAWQKQADFLSFFIDHQRMDRISETMQMARIALERDRAFDFAIHLAALKTAAEMLHGAEAFVLKNIW